MFFVFLIMTLSTAIASLSLLIAGNFVMGTSLLGSSVLVSSSGYYYYCKRKLKKKIAKKVVKKLCDCDCVPDCAPDCDGPDCDCNCD
jgi:hypothetical protein